jgi:signal transduction histidine kinase
MIVLALAVAVVVFAFSAGLDWFLLHESESRAAAFEFSDALGAVIAGALSFRVLQYERQRRRQIRQRLETIGNMNHHIRNALQVISGTAYSAADKEQLMAIRESVRRIEWALREILPRM